MEGNTLIILVVVGLVAILTGFLISRYVLNKTMRTKEQLAEQKAKAIVKDAEADSEVIKKNAVAGYGGLITFCEPTLEARESTLDRIRLDTGATVVHPYNDERSSAG